MSDGPLSPRERRRNARELERRMAELDRLDATYGLGTLPSAASRRPARRSRRTSTAGAAIATVALVTLAVLYVPSAQMEAARRVLGLGADRELPAPTVGGAGGPFKFSMTQRGGNRPVGWNPCEPIRFRINPAGAPEGGTELIERAIDRASDATGLAFEHQGVTDERPFTSRLVPIGTDRPVVIGWGTAQEFPDLAGDVAGIGGGAAEQGALGRAYLVTGSVALDTSAFTSEAIAANPGGMEAIVLHEIAHVIGLGHVSDPAELMAPSNSGQLDFGPGDREGLARLGSIPCA